MATHHTFPALHNAMWPGLVGKGGPGAEPPIDLDTMLNLTAAAQVNGTRFDGVDLFLFDPHVSIDSSDDDLKRLADKIGSKGLVVGSLVAPVWPPTGGGSAMGSNGDRGAFLTQVRKACAIGKKLRDLGIRRYGIVRIDSAAGPADWAADPLGNTKKIAETFRQAADIAEDYGERLAAEGEICWGGMHSVTAQRGAARRRSTAPRRSASRPTWRTRCSSPWGTTRRTIGSCRTTSTGRIARALDEGLKKMTRALRPWTIDFHVAQNDGTVKGSGSHDKTGRHCLPHDPNGKLDIVRHAGFWLRDDNGRVERKLDHICWDGCMFPNAVMTEQQTWNDVLGVMTAVRDAHGWD